MRQNAWRHPEARRGETAEREAEESATLSLWIFFMCVCALYPQICYVFIHLSICLMPEPKCACRGAAALSAAVGESDHRSSWRRKEERRMWREKWTMLRKQLGDTTRRRRRANRIQKTRSVPTLIHKCQVKILIGEARNFSDYKMIQIFSLTNWNSKKFFHLFCNPFIENLDRIDFSLI